MLRKHTLLVATFALSMTLLGCELSLTGPDIVPDLPDLKDAKDAVAFEQLASVAAASVQGSTCVAPGSAVSWWPGEDNFDDVAGTNPIARTGGVAFEPGVVGQGFRFNQGLGQPFLEIDDSPSLRPATFTIDFWAQRFGAGQNNDAFGNILVEKAIDDGNLAGLILSYFIAWTQDDRIQAGVFFEDDAAVDIRLVGSSVHPFGSVVHVALSFDGVTATLYVNGTAEDTYDASGRPPVAYGGGSVVIGATFPAARNAGFPRSPDGIVDELEIFNFALTSDQILQIYQTSGACKLPAEPDPEPEPEAPSVHEVQVDIKPGGERNVIRFPKNWLRQKSGKSAKSGKSEKSGKSRKSVRGKWPGPNVAVAVLGTESWDASGVDVSTVTLGDEVDLDVGVTIKPRKKRNRKKHDEPRFHASLRDVDHDGYRDLVVHFGLKALVRNGDVTAETTQLCLNGMTSEGPQFRGCDAVTVRTRKR